MAELKNQGYIYIGFNPYHRDNWLKIGCTKRAPKIRLKELSRATGVLGDYELVYEEYLENYKYIEKLIHEKLKNYRIPKNSSSHKQKEMFNLSLQEAIFKIQELTQREIYRIEKLSKNERHILTSNMTLRWFCYPQDLIMICRYENIFHLAEVKPNVEIWECKNGDQILITNEEFNIFYFQKKDFFTINGSLSEVVSLYPGDRIAWIGKNKIDSSEYSILSILDCRTYTKLMGFSTDLIFVDGLPIQFGLVPNGILSNPTVPKICHETFSKIRELGIPRNLPNPLEKLEDSILSNNV